MLALSITPQGHIHLHSGESSQEESLSRRIAAAFAVSPSKGLLHLATVELQSHLSPSLEFARHFARSYLTHLCQTPCLEDAAEIEPLAPPAESDLSTLCLSAPPMVGLEYLRPEVLESWWNALDEWVRQEVRRCPGGAAAYLRELNPLWRFVGRVTFHLAENKRDTEYPFAFMATYASRLSDQGKVQHEPLSRALDVYSGAKNRPILLSLLMPLSRAAERSELAKELIESGDVYHPLRWTPHEAYQFLQDVPIFEESGVIVRVPNWWQGSRPSRPQVRVEVGHRSGAGLNAGALLDFSVAAALDGEDLSDSELQSILSSEGGLVLLKGKWVEVDREKLAEALAHWKRVEASMQEEGGITFFEGMRLLSGVSIGRDTEAAVTAESNPWVGVAASADLQETLEKLRDPSAGPNGKPPGLAADLRPYQSVGVGWLRLLSQLGLGACLADDMGLGKTIQVLSLLLYRQADLQKVPRNAAKDRASLLVVPASLIANWKSEIERFAPSLRFAIAHPSEMELGSKDDAPQAFRDVDLDLVVTTYGMLPRLSWLRGRSWSLVILDEAQAIKNVATRQSKSVKELKASARIALTGTPIENRLGDVWSLFHFLNPGLLGSAKEFSTFTKQLDDGSRSGYGPLRKLIQPYILRRLKTDKRVIADLPDKTEATAYCGLTKRQAALYQKVVKDLALQLKTADGVQRRGLVLSQIMRLKQICNHPAQVTGGVDYQPDHSGKFQRLAEICDELMQRQERVLVFTQFREITEPLAAFLKGIFGREGLVLHGGTNVAKRRDLVAAFQQEDGPPFFVLSLKAGGTGLNLTAASHVVHFDRWWNPAVENQATDRAFRIGQRRNVLVHKFVCRGTVEEKIDHLLTEKSTLVKDLLEGTSEVRLTEMDNDELLEILTLDLHKAVDS